MMQAADARQRDQTRRLARLGGNRPHCRCVFLKRVMDPVRILPRACSACACRLHAAGCKQLGYLPSKLAVTIKNRVAILTRFPNGLPQLLHNPRPSRVFRHIEMEDPAAAMLDEHATTQDSERQG